MGNLCKYKNLFGPPGKGVHSIRVFDIAIVDVIATIVGTKIIQLVINEYFNIKITFTRLFIYIGVLGIILHRLFCVRTTIDKLLFE